MKDREWISEQILEVMIFLAAFWTAGDLAQTVYRWTYRVEFDSFAARFDGSQHLLYYLVRGALIAVLVQAAARKLTDSERARCHGQISWFEPWRIAQVVVLASVYIMWAYWAASQLTFGAEKVAIRPVHPGLVIIAGLGVFSSLGWPTLFRSIQPLTDAPAEE